MPPAGSRPTPAAWVHRLYEAFNARQIDALLGQMAPDVDWPNAWEGGRLIGQAAVRDYWIRQWAAIDPSVDPISTEVRPDGSIAVEVAQSVRDLDGALIAEGRVTHVYRLRDGLIARMDVEAATNLPRVDNG